MNFTLSSTDCGMIYKEVCGLHQGFVKGPIGRNAGFGGKLYVEGLGFRPEIDVVGRHAPSPHLPQSATLLKSNHQGLPASRFLSPSAEPAG